MNNFFFAVQKDVAMEVDGEMAAILQSSRFCSDFQIQISDKPAQTCTASTKQVDKLPKAFIVKR